LWDSLYCLFFCILVSPQDTSCPIVKPYRPPLWEAAHSFKLIAESEEICGYVVKLYVSQDESLRRSVEYIKLNDPSVTLTSTPYLYQWFDELTSWSRRPIPDCRCEKNTIVDLGEGNNFWWNFLGPTSTYQGACEDGGNCGELWSATGELGGSSLTLTVCLQMHSKFHLKGHRHDRTPDPILPSNIFVPPTPLYFEFFSVLFPGPIKINMTYWDYEQQPESEFIPPDNCIFSPSPTPHPKAKSINTNNNNNNNNNNNPPNLNKAVWLKNHPKALENNNNNDNNNIIDKQEAKRQQQFEGKRIPWFVSRLAEVVIRDLNITVKRDDGSGYDYRGVCIAGREEKEKEKEEIETEIEVEEKEEEVKSMRKKNRNKGKEEKIVEQRTKTPPQCIVVLPHVETEFNYLLAHPGRHQDNPFNE